MRINAMLLIMSALLLAGCLYESPLIKEHSLAIDTSSLGLWQLIPDEGEEADPEEKMMILRYSDTEYMVHYPISGNEVFYYRAYPIKIGNRSYIQIEVIGSEDGPIDPQESDSKEIYHVVSYTLEAGVLTITTLNSNLIDEDLKDSAALMKAFIENQDNKELFNDPGKFRKVE